MTVVGWALSAATVLAGLGVVAAAIAPDRVRAALAGTATAGVGGAGAVAGVAAVTGTSFAAYLPDLLPLAGVHLAADPLGGLFVAVTGAVVAVAAGYGIGYSAPRRGGAHGPGHGGAHGPGHGAGRAAQAVPPVFALAMLLVPFAASLPTLAATWELMAVTSLLLVVVEHRRRERVRSAGLWYAAMTQFGFVTILLGLVLLAARADGTTFAELRDAEASPALRGLVFVLVLAGFGSKAGLVPLHVWLPRAHPEAPSHVSAMLSAAMVNLGAYGVIRVGFDLLHGGSRWWWLLVMAAGGVSALFGILQAAVSSDLKRLLAYSTVENMGLVFLGVGTAGLLRASGAAPHLAALALAAALLHVVNHAGFKALLFLAAGSVLRATGTRDLDALGGLRSRMPVTTALFAAGALGAAALPPGNGFVSEWLLLQSLVHAVPAGGVATAVAMPVAVGVVALTAGLAVATMVKALGVGFFARPRGDAAARATESPTAMLAAMGLLGLACVALALAPAALGPALSAAVGTATGQAGDTTGQAATGEPTTVLGGGVTLEISGVTSTMSPLWMVSALLVAVVAGAAVLRRATVRAPRRRAAPLWDCGAGRPTARMQYTATSFAEPLQRVFDDVLAPETDVDVTGHTGSRYLVARVAYRLRVPDRIEHALYRPLVSGTRRVGRAGTALANGSVHRYLTYGFVGVTAFLLILAVTR